MSLFRTLRRGLFILAMLLLSSCSSRQHLYRSGVAAQRRAEQALEARDTAAALRHFRDAYVALVDSDHPEAWPEVLAGIMLCEQALEGMTVSEDAMQQMLAQTRASAAGHLTRLEQERSRKRQALLLAGTVMLLALLVAVLLVTAQRKRRLETENALLKTRMDLQEQRQQMEQLRAKANSPALALALRSYEQLCSRYNPDGDNAALLREFRQQMADLRDDAAFSQALESAMEESDPDLPHLIRDLPGLRDEERRLLRFLAAGLPTHLVAAALGKSRNAINMQISRLRTRIESLDTPERARLLRFFASRRPGRPK